MKKTILAVIVSFFSIAHAEILQCNNVENCQKIIDFQKHVDLVNKVNFEIFKEMRTYCRNTLKSQREVVECKDSIYTYYTKLEGLYKNSLPK